MQKCLLDYTNSQDEKEVAIAVSNGTIISNMEMSSLLDYIAKTRMLLGMPKDYNNKEELVIATQFVHTKFGNLTTNEFDLAFNLFIMQKYDTDIQFYGMLSPLFISQVLNAYLNYKKPKLADAIMRRDKAKLDEDAKSKEPTKEQKAEMQKVIIKQFWNDWKQKGEFTDLLSLSYKFFANNKELFKFTFDKKIIVEATEWANYKLLQDRANGGFFKYTEKDENKQKDRYCCIWCVMNYFSRFENVNEILNLITPELWS
jgi:hypothetical protein